MHFTSFLRFFLFTSPSSRTPGKVQPTLAIFCILVCSYILYIDYPRPCSKVRLPQIIYMFLVRRRYTCWISMLRAWCIGLCAYFDAVIRRRRSCSTLCIFRCGSGRCALCFTYGPCGTWMTIPFSGTARWHIDRECPRRRDVFSRGLSPDQMHGQRKIVARQVSFTIAICEIPVRNK